MGSGNMYRSTCCATASAGAHRRKKRNNERIGRAVGRDKAVCRPRLTSNTSKHQHANPIPRSPMRATGRATRKRRKVDSPFARVSVCTEMRAIHKKKRTDMPPFQALITEPALPHAVSLPSLSFFVENNVQVDHASGQGEPRERERRTHTDKARYHAASGCPTLS